MASPKVTCKFRYDPNHCANGFDILKNYQWLKDLKIKEININKMWIKPLRFRQYLQTKSTSAMVHLDRQSSLCSKN